MLGDIVRGSKVACHVPESVYARHDGKSSEIPSGQGFATNPVLGLAVEKVLLRVETRYFLWTRRLLM